MHHAQYTRPTARSPPPKTNAAAPKGSTSHNSSTSATMPRRGAQQDSEKANKVRAAMLARDNTTPAMRAMPNFASGPGVATPMALVDNGAVAVNKVRWRCAVRGASRFSWNHAVNHAFLRLEDFVKDGSERFFVCLPEKVWCTHHFDHLKPRECNWLL